MQWTNSNFKVATESYDKYNQKIILHTRAVKFFDGPSRNRKRVFDWYKKFDSFNNLYSACSYEGAYDDSIYVAKLSCIFYMWCLLKSLCMVALSSFGERSFFLDHQAPLSDYSVLNWKKKTCGNQPDGK